MKTSESVILHIKLESFFLAQSQTTVAHIYLHSISFILIPPPSLLSNASHLVCVYNTIITPLYHQENGINSVLVLCSKLFKSNISSTSRDPSRTLILTLFYVRLTAKRSQKSRIFAWADSHFQTLLTNVLSTCLIRKNSFCSSISCWLEGEKKSITLTTHKNFLKEAESLKHILLLCHSYPKTNHLDTSGRTALTAFIREVPESHGHRIV